MMNKDAFLQAARLKRREVKVKALDDKAVNIRELTALERKVLFKIPNYDNITNFDVAHYIVARGLLNAEGQAMFSGFADLHAQEDLDLVDWSEQAEELQALSPDVILELSDKITELSGLKPEQVAEQAEK